MTYADPADRAARQAERAVLIGWELTGRKPGRNLVASILALVVADERTDIPRVDAPREPAPGARQILSAPVQEALF